MIKIPSDLAPVLLSAVSSRIKQLENVACANTLRALVFESRHEDAKEELEKLKTIRALTEFVL